MTSLAFEERGGASGDGNRNTLHYAAPFATGVKPLRTVEGGYGIVNAGHKTLAIQADAVDQAAVRAGVQQAAQEFSKIDILVNSAGVLALGQIADFPAKDFERALSVNVADVPASGSQPGQLLPQHARTIPGGRRHGGAFGDSADRSRAPASLWL